MLKAGQILWYVGRYDRYTKGHSVTITKVGRKWAETSIRKRINIETMEADGGQYASPGCCYESKEAYEQMIALNKEWRDLAERLPRDGIAPQGLTMEDIAHIRRVLKRAQESAQ